jgi:hypothetical protein
MRGKGGLRKRNRDDDEVEEPKFKHAKIELVNALPQEILHLIMSYCDVPTIFKATATCQAWYHAIKYEMKDIWKKHLEAFEDYLNVDSNFSNPCKLLAKYYTWDKAIKINFYNRIYNDSDNVPELIQNQMMASKNVTQFHKHKFSEWFDLQDREDPDVWDSFDDSRLYHCQFYNEATKQTYEKYYWLSGGNPGAHYYIGDHLEPFCTMWDCSCYTREEDFNEPQNEDLASFLNTKFFKRGWGGAAGGCPLCRVPEEERTCDHVKYGVQCNET